MTKRQFVEKVERLMKLDADNQNVLNWEWGFADEWKRDDRIDMVSRYQLQVEEFLSKSEGEVLLCLFTGVEWDDYEDAYPEEVHWGALVKPSWSGECKILAVTGVLKEGGITFSSEDVTGAFI